VANTSRPLLVDIACRDGDPFSTCKHKFACLTAIRWEFDSPFEAGCEDQIVMKNQLGSFILASRALEGRSGLDLSASPYPAGKLKIMLKSRASGTRRARVILWANGEWVTWESI